ncbi:MAG: hypothetical protein AAF614_10410 [Chloroflexota bacterium]
MNHWSKQIMLLLLLGLLMGCGSSVPLGESFSIEADDSPVRVAGTDLEIASCFKGEDISQDGGELWVAVSGTQDGREFRKETYSKSVSVGAYEIEIIGADFFGGCTLTVQTIE